MTAARRVIRAQRGIALMAMLAILVLGSSWFLISRLNTSSAQMLATKRSQNAAVLNRAKLALIGYVAAQAIKAGEDNPGALPCPEAAGYFDDPVNQGKAASSCTLPKVGRFPWKTIGTEKLVDADGEALWYVVSPGWGYTSRTNYPVINSNSQGQLTVDGVPNAAVALLIAPGAAFEAASASGCTAWNQTRSPSGTPDYRNYVECENATSPADSVFVTRGPGSQAFNDTVVTLSAAEIMPGIEAAVAKRIEAEIAPVLKQMYADNTWGPNISAAKPVYPFAAGFSNPNNATYRGAGVTQGLLPMTYATDYTWNGSSYVASPCNPATNARCAPASFMTWGTPTATKTGGGGSIGAPYCTSDDPSFSYCMGSYSGSVQLLFEDVLLNVGNAMRIQGDALYTEMYWYDSNFAFTQVFGGTLTSRLSSDGSFRIRQQTPSFPSNGSGYLIYSYRIPMLDHPLLDTRYSSSGGPSTSWFVRNEWYKLLYYVVAPGHSPSVLPSMPSCSTGVNCISIASLDPANPITTPNGQRAMLILAGRSVNNVARPSSSVGDYLESGNATGLYQRRKVFQPPPSSAAVYSDTGAANAYVIPAPAVAAGSSIYFKATNANTGAATLRTSVMSATPIVNPDGTNVSAGQITAGNVVRVSYDGGRFVLLGIPFNDRISIVDSN